MSDYYPEPEAVLALFVGRRARRLPVYRHRTRGRVRRDRQGPHCLSDR